MKLIVLYPFKKMKLKLKSYQVTCPKTAQLVGDAGRSLTPKPTAHFTAHGSFHNPRLI